MLGLPTQIGVTVAVRGKYLDQNSLAWNGTHDLIQLAKLEKYQKLRIFVKMKEHI